jgi:hypothetical protein
MAWQITPDWQYQPELARSSEVEVRFTPIPGGLTRVDLEHRHFERHGTGAETVKAAVDSPQGWGDLLQLFTETASSGTDAGATPASGRTDASVAAGPLALIFKLNDAWIAGALDGLTDDQVWQRTSDANNPMLWIVGHGIDTRVHLLRLLGQSVETGWGDLFARGAVVSEAGRYPSRLNILEKQAEIGKRLQSALRSLTADDMARPAIGPQLPGASTLGEQIGFFALHDSYHVGQLGFIRKALGLSSLIG